MSENLDLVRSIYADWERGDFSRADWADPEIEFVTIGGVEAGSWTGLTEMAGTMRERLSVWENLHLRAEQCREVGGGRVLVAFTGGSRGKLSGLDMDQKGAHLFELRNGKVTRLVLYWDRDRALADLGLEG